jgi:hypothetical protein
MLKISVFVCRVCMYGFHMSLRINGVNWSSFIIEMDNFFYEARAQV